VTARRAAPPTSRRTVRASAAALACLFAGALSACAVPRGGAGRLGLRADVVEAPRTVPTADGHLVAYELEVHNEGESSVRIERLVRRRSDGREDSVAGEPLALRAVPKRRVADPAERLEVPPGGRAVLLLDAAFAGSPPSFEHDLVVSGIGVTGRRFEETLTATERPPDAADAVVVGPPVLGGGWRCENGPSTVSGHRRAVVWLRHAPRAAQRFAVDLFRADAAGRTSTGDPRANASYRAFGAEVLAVADARVAVAVDGVPDNVPDPNERAVEMSNETIAGNHVVLDLGGGRWAMYAHLRQGSVAVRAGDAVVRGQVLARIGNSGNSTEPHLHFHVADGPSPVDASGLPFVFDAFAAGGAQFAGVLPSEGAVVLFR
jgi:murein DD-endopeptidase MepM/ murein hydrolase activator NlpD